MEAKLIKTQEGYTLNDVEGNPIGQTFGKFQGKRLSLKNCQAIERGYDLDELAKSACPDVISSANSAYKAGFQKALEILGDKKFTEGQVLNAFYAGWISKDKLYLEAQKSYKGYLKRRVTQQTEWDVEVEMECVMGCQNLILNGENSVCCGDKKPKLNADGCLILKRK